MKKKLFFHRFKIDINIYFTNCCGPNPGRHCTINVNESRGWKETDYPLFESKKKDEKM